MEIFKQHFQAGYKFMENEHVKTNSINQELIDLNNKFHKKLLLTEEFYKQLKQIGFNYQQCFLISIFPDSANTYCGKIINQNGEIVEFDIDLDDFSHSSWQKTILSLKDLNKNDQKKNLKTKEIAAYRLFSKLNEN